VGITLKNKPKSGELAQRCPLNVDPTSNALATVESGPTRLELSDQGARLTAPRINLN